MKLVNMLSLTARVTYYSFTCVPAVVAAPQTFKLISGAYLGRISYNPGPV